MPSTDRRLELKEKTSVAQNAWQASVYANGLMDFHSCFMKTFRAVWQMSHMGTHDGFHLLFWN